MNIRDMLNPLDEKREYHYAGKFVSPEGMEEIKDLLSGSDALNGGYAFNIPNFDPAWLITSGELQGTLPKRIAHLYFKTFGKTRAAKNIPAKVLAEIGNIASRHCGNGQDYIYDITEDFNWRSGDFGDEGSCYFSSRTGARDMMSEHDSLAIRFYEKDSYGEDEGYGRAWIAFPESHEIKVSSGPKPTNICLVFNSYPSSQPLCRVARLIATILGLSYKGPIDFSNNGDTDGTLWINGGRCYAIGKDIENVTKINLEWEDENAMACAECGCYISEDDHYHNIDDEDICEECFSERYFFCERCAATFSKDIRITVNDCEYCERCAKKYGYAPCLDCGEWLEEDNQKEAHGNTYCESCWEEKFGDCEECGETFYLDDLKEGLCEDCRLAPCDRCEIKFDPADLEDGLCEECRTKETA